MIRLFGRLYSEGDSHTDGPDGPDGMEKSNRTDKTYGTDGQNHSGLSLVLIGDLISSCLKSTNTNTASNNINNININTTTSTSSSTPATPPATHEIDLIYDDILEKCIDILKHK